MRYQKILITLAMITLSHSAYSMCGYVPADCDTNNDLVVDENDINAIILAKGTTAEQGDNQFDPDGDLMVTTLDARVCADICTDGICDVPKLLGPVLPHDEIALGTGPTDLAALGYQRKEYILADIARSYTPELPVPSDGKLVVTADAEDVAGDFNTRLVVLRPIDPAQFNGTVVLEWLNVTAGGDAAPDWGFAHNEFIREGYAWVGVTAQEVGVDFLHNNPNLNGRYAALLHPGDSYSYDIFSRAGLLAGEPNSTLLGDDGLTADVVLANGESQSASRMVTYIDAIQPVENVYDGFLVHSRGSSGSKLRQSPLVPEVSLPSGTPIRDDLDAPVMVLQAEGDMIRSDFATRQVDTLNFRLWEMAGTSHVDAYTTLIGGNDPGDGSGTIKMFEAMRVGYNFIGCTSVNAGATHWIVQAAFNRLNTWARGGEPAPSAPGLTTVSGEVTRDENGNALGGVRSPHVDAPLATLDSESNGGGGFCFLYGRTIPFTPARVVELYPTKVDFTQKWSDAIDTSVTAGFLLEVDGDDLKAAAEAWDYPN